MQSCSELTKLPARVSRNAENKDFSKPQIQENDEEKWVIKKNKKYSIANCAHFPHLSGNLCTQCEQKSTPFAAREVCIEPFSWYELKHWSISTSPMGAKYATIERGHVWLSKRHGLIVPTCYESALPYTLENCLGQKVTLYWLFW